MNIEERTEHHVFCNYSAFIEKPKDCKQCRGLYATYGDREITDILENDFPDVIVRDGTHPDFPLVQK